MTRRLWKSLLLLALVFLVFGSFTLWANTADKTPGDKIEAKVPEKQALKNTSFATAVDPKKVELELNSLSQRYNRHELALQLSTSFKETAKASAHSLSLFSYYGLLLGGFIEPGLAFIFKKDMETQLYGGLIDLTWHFKDILADDFVPYLALGLGYADLTFLETELRFTGYYLPALKLGFKYFIRSNAALNINYAYYNYSLSEVASKEKLTLSDRGLMAGFSVFF